MKRPDHGMKGTPTYNTWSAMKQRCNYPAHDQYAAYGGRGIVVCARWDNSFESFFADMGEKPNGMSIERIDNEGPYEKENCKWATMSEQQRNRRTTLLVERDGEILCVKDWADRIGINPDRIYGRIRRGAAPAAAIEWAISCKK